MRICIDDAAILQLLILCICTKFHDLSAFREDSFLQEQEYPRDRNMVHLKVAFPSFPAGHRSGHLIYYVGPGTSHCVMKRKTDLIRFAEPLGS